MLALGTAMPGLDNRVYPVRDQVEICPRYNALTERQRDVYDRMLSTFRSGSLKVPLHTDCSSREVSDAYDAVVHDHPELYHLNDNGRMQGTALLVGTNVTEFAAKQMISSQRYADSWHRIRSLISAVIGGASVRWDAYQRVRYLYEWMSMNVTYDLDAPRGQTMDGALLDRRAVCAGISDAFCLAARALGVPAGCVSVRDVDGVGHRINLVRIKGVYTFVDCTNGSLSYGNAPSDGRDSMPRLTYRFLCHTTAELRRSYAISPGQLVPTCGCRDYDWFRLHNLTLGPVFCSEQLDALLSSAYACGKSSLEVKCASSRVYHDALRWVGADGVFGGRFGSLMSRGAGLTRRLMHTQDDAMRTITIAW